MLLICQFEKFLNNCFRINRLTASHNQRDQQYVIRHQYTCYSFPLPDRIINSSVMVWTAWGIPQISPPVSLAVKVSG